MYGNTKIQEPKDKKQTVAAGRQVCPLWRINFKPEAGSSKSEGKNQIANNKKQIKLKPGMRSAPDEGGSAQHLNAKPGQPNNKNQTYLPASRFVRCGGSKASNPKSEGMPAELSAMSSAKKRMQPVVSGYLR